jgi:hypothetical protein
MTNERRHREMGADAKLAWQREKLGPLPHGHTSYHATTAAGADSSSASDVVVSARACAAARHPATAVAAVVAAADALLWQYVEVRGQRQGGISGATLGVGSARALVPNSRFFLVRRGHFFIFAKRFVVIARRCFSSANCFVISAYVIFVPAHIFGLLLFKYAGLVGR